MNKLLATALLLTTGLSMSAHASLISGPQMFADGKTVNLQGLEWMPLTYTVGLSRNQVEAAGGFTDNFGGVWNVGDWRYASRSETEALLSSLWGGRYDGFSPDNYDGAAAFLALFGSNFHPFQNLSYARFAFGNDGECTQSITKSCHGSVSTWLAFSGNVFAYDKLNEWKGVNFTFSGNIGSFEDVAGVEMGRDTSNVAYEDGYFPVSSYSHLLVRKVDTPVTTVNTPTALSLFALGLCGLLLRRRKIAA